MKKIIKIHYILDSVDKIRIRKQLLDMELTQLECAEKMGVSVAYFNSILCGKRVITPKIIRQFKSIGINLEMEE